MADREYEIPKDSAVSSNDIHPNTNLSETDLRHANLSRADLRNADLSGADLRNTNLSRADLDNANLSETNLYSADLSETNLCDADISKAILRSTDLSEANLRGADLSRANLFAANLPRVDINNGNLSKTNLYLADLSDATLRDANLSDAALQDTDLSQADLRDADLSGTEMKYTNLSGADLRDTLFSGMSLRGSNITAADLRGATLDNVVVSVTTTCNRLYEGYDRGRFLPESIRRIIFNSTYDIEQWDDTIRSYKQLKQSFSKSALNGKARKMHIGERRARSIQAKRSSGWFSWRYISTLPSRFITGYGVRIRTLLLWMILLLVISTYVYLQAGIRETTSKTITYSVLAFTVAPPPPLPSEMLVQTVVMIETFFGTVSTVLLGYILGNRERI